MKLFRYGPPGFERPGIVDRAGQLRDLSAAVGDIDRRLLASDLQQFARSLDMEQLPLVAPSVRFAMPIRECGKFICVGLNYAEHAAESGAPIPTEPILFLKATSALMGPNDTVRLPLGSSKVDWEVELGVVIGRGGKYIAERDALNHVAGVCVINDISERNFQLERGGQWDKGKGCDTFGPVGPYLVTLDEAGDLDNLELWLDLNGQRMQAGNTNDMIFNVPYLVHYISQFMSLQPGDIISTGTPRGVALGMAQPRWLRDGDQMRVGIAGLGEQCQTVQPDCADGAQA